MNIEEKYFEINEIDNLIDELEMVSHFLESLIMYKWKWGTVALHQALSLYGTLILVLQRTDLRQTVVDKGKDRGKAFMLHIQKVPIDIIASSFGKSEESVPDWIANPYLISLGEALRRVKRKEYLPPFGNAKPLTVASEEDAIRKLTKEFRNGFEYFAPKA